MFDNSPDKSLNKLQEIEKKVKKTEENIQKSIKNINEAIGKNSSLSDLLRRAAESISGDSKKGFVTDIEDGTIENKDFRRVLYTGKNMQLVLMSLLPGEDIGEEIHKDTDQFFRIESGTGKVIINGKESAITDGSAIIIPQGASHNVINTGKNQLKIYTIYSPPHHKDKLVHKTKEEASNEGAPFDGIPTEKSASSI